jgi:hypothetical protein
VGAGTPGLKLCSLQLTASEEKSRSRASAVRLRALAASDPPNHTPERKRGNRSRFDQARNQLIADDVVHLIQEGRFPLVLTLKTGNLDILAGLVAG